MITVVPSTNFTSKCKGKYTEAEIDELIEAIGLNPKNGQKLQSANCVYRHPWTRASDSKYEYDVYYIYHSVSCPVLIVNIFRRGEKDVLSKVIACLADDATRV
jgi:hypothetical protein